MYPILLEIGPIKIYAYGFMIAMGICLSLFLIKRNIIRSSINANVMIDFVLSVLFFGIIGSRILFIVLNFENFRYDWMSVIKIWEGGLVFYGGVIFASIMLMILTSIKNIRFFTVSDALVPFLSLTQGFGRIGCFLNGCCWGKPTMVFWAVKFPFMSDFVHPVQLYESIFCFALFAYLIILYKKKVFQGQTTLYYFILYAMGRFFIEFYRGDQASILFFLTRSQIMSICIWCIGVALFIHMKKCQTNEHK